jgi:hypothetical protein
VLYFLDMFAVYWNNLHAVLKLWISNGAILFIFVRRRWLWWLSSSGRWHRVALLVSYEPVPIQELTTSLCTSSHSCTLKMEAIRSSETSVLIRATRRHLPKDDNHSHRRGNLKSYKILFWPLGWRDSERIW